MNLPCSNCSVVDGLKYPVNHNDELLMVCHDCLESDTTDYSVADVESQVETFEL